MRFLRLFFVFVRIGLLGDLAYRANFWFQVLESGISMAITLGAVAVVFTQTDELAGWLPYEIVALLGIYFLVRGLLNVVVAPSLERFMEQVQTGTFDFNLTKPVDAQLLTSIQEVRVWKGIDGALGLALLIFALSKLTQQVGPYEAATFAVTLAAGGAMVYSVWLVLATLCFWFIRIENILVIFWNLYWAARWPVGIYPGWLRWTLTLIIPVAFAVTVPAEAVSGRLSGSNVVLAVTLAVALLCGSRWFWRFGLRHYSGASA